jgi:hypothetical protein
LEACAAVGVTDDLAGFAGSVTRLSRRVTQVPRERLNVGLGGQRPVDSETVRLIQSFNEVDAELHRVATEIASARPPEDSAPVLLPCRRYWSAAMRTPCPGSGPRVLARGHWWRRATTDVNLPIPRTQGPLWVEGVVSAEGSRPPVLTCSVADDSCSATNLLWDAAILGWRFFGPVGRKGAWYTSVSVHPAPGTIGLAWHDVHVKQDKFPSYRLWRRPTFAALQTLRSFKRRVARLAHDHPTTGVTG